MHSTGACTPALCAHWGSGAFFAVPLRLGVAVGADAVLDVVLEAVVRAVVVAVAVAAAVVLVGAVLVDAVLGDAVLVDAVAVDAGVVGAAWAAVALSPTRAAAPRVADEAARRRASVHQREQMRMGLPRKEATGWGNGRWGQMILSTSCAGDLDILNCDLVPGPAIWDGEAMSKDIDPTVAPSGTGCVECLDGSDPGWWFHLRRCASCGQIGCCDSSPGQHSSAHFQATGHPIMASFEPGEDWFWDFSAENYTSGPELAAPRSHPRDQPVPGPAGSVPRDWQQQLN